MYSWKANPGNVVRSVCRGRTDVTEGPMTTGVMDASVPYVGDSDGFLGIYICEN